MDFEAGTWWLIAILAGIAISVIGYFLKRTMGQVDGHDKDIQIIKQTYVTEDECKDLKTEIMNQVDAHDKDIQTIKQTYVTKDEFKDLRAEIRGEFVKILDDVDDIKKNSLTKVDFYRAQGDTNDSIKRIYDLLIKRGGGEK